MIKNDKNMNILDIGCGSGLLGEIIKKETDAKVYGLDISENFVKSAKERLDGAFVFDANYDFELWPEEIRNIKFNNIIITDVLEHLSAPEKLLENLKKIINRDTEIILTIPNVLFWKNRLKIMFGRFEYTEEGLMDRTHIHFFTWKSLKKLLKECGYSIIIVTHHFPTRYTGFVGSFFPGLFSFKFIIKIKKNEN